jgi:anti-sigma regulatory factor (Ser/Thr protein kinase)
MPENLTKLNAITLDAFFSRHNPLKEPDCKFDLNGIQLITPGALVPIAAACHALAQDGRKPIIAIRDPAIRSYLLRSGFFSVVGNIGKCEPAISHELTDSTDALRGMNPMLLELTKIESSTELPNLLANIASTLRGRLGFNRNEASDIAIAISEICQNTFEHNQAVAGFIAMQVYGRGAKRFVEVAIGDGGIGLANTLRRNRKNLPITSDLDAIRIAVRRGTSQFDDPTRGTGLYHLLEIAAKHKGSLQFRSGAAALRFRMDKRKRWGFSSVTLPGVQISLLLDAKQRG